MRNRKIILLAGAIEIAALLGGCGSAQHDATEAAINAAQTAINAAQGAAEKFVPEQTKAAQDALQSAKESLAKGSYAEALKEARDATQKAKEAVSAATAKKEEWANTWQSLNATAPKVLSEVQAKVDIYNKYGRYPKGVDKEHMDAAIAQLNESKQGWGEVTSLYKNGNWAEAMKKAATLQEGLQKLKDLLSVQPKT